MIAKNQLTKQEAQELFEYRDGMLYWRHAASGRRRDMAAITNKAGRNGSVKKIVRIGGTDFPAAYLIWNWHNGISGEPIRCPSGDLRIENLERRQKIITPLSRPIRASCPCCRQTVKAPTTDVIVSMCGLTKQEAAVLRAVWDGNGSPVYAERIFAKMYEDDLDGGPAPHQMYTAFKVALCHLRKKLKGSGVDVINIGYRKGYKLVIGEN